MIVRPGVGIMGNILQAGVPEFVNDPPNDPRVVRIPGTPEVEEDPECLMGAPLISRGRVIGGLMVWRLRRNGLFTQAELDFLVSVARQTQLRSKAAVFGTQRRATMSAWPGWGTRSRRHSRPRLELVAGGLWASGGREQRCS
jgi:signal transduction protein with GAF and PtsI domain